MIILRYFNLPGLDYKRQLTDQQKYRRRLNSANTCLLCHEICSSTTLCGSCRQDLKTIDNPCSICSLEITIDTPGSICGSCLKNTPHFHHSTIPLEYAFPIEAIIKSLKYKQKYFYSELLGKILLDSIYTRNSPRPECIIPVPLHAMRLFKRGFNQSELIASYLADHLQIPLETHCCKRIKNTQHQANLSVKLRRKIFLVHFLYRHLSIINMLPLWTMW